MDGRKAAPLFLVSLCVSLAGLHLMFGVGVALLVGGIAGCVAAVFFYEPVLDAQRKEQQRLRAQQAEAGKPRFQDS